MAKEIQLLQSLSHLFNANDLKRLEEGALAELKAQRQWFGAIAALESLLLSLPADETGLILSGPTGILSHPYLVNRMKTGIFSPEALKNVLLTPFQLPAASENTAETVPWGGITELPLFPQDPIAKELFCLIFTPKFGLLMVLGEDFEGNSQFHFSFDPEMVYRGWTLLKTRLLITHHPQLGYLEAFINDLNIPCPDYHWVMEFSRLLLHHLPDLPPSSLPKTRRIETATAEINHHELLSSDAELLQALTHEIRTPLTTIRTMTQLLLKRGKLTPQMEKCLEVIDQECTEQIDRMELIFQAAEMESTPFEKKNIQLVTISLKQVVQNSIPRWQKQAQRRNIKLDFLLPDKLPQIISDPAKLDQMLGGLMEKVTRSIPSGGEIKIQVSTAGHQLKLQVYSSSNYFNNPFKALGQLLMFQPNTGSVSLNFNVTKNLFQALGGKLIVREQPSKQGEIFTIFLPLDNVSSSVEV